MKTLYEGILDDIEDTLQAGDKYVEAVKELDITKKISVKDWESIIGDEVYNYIIKCPKWFELIGLSEFTGIFCEITFFVDSKSNIWPGIDIAVINDDGLHQRHIDNVIPGLSPSKTRNNAERIINKAIKDNINSKNAYKLRKIILSQI